MKKKINDATCYDIQYFCDECDKLEESLIHDSVLKREDINFVLIKMWTLARELNELTFKEFDR